MLIDLHNHVLPGVDDGSPNLTVSMNMIRAASAQGITDIINTVHFQHPKMDMIPITIEDIAFKTQELQKEIDSAGLSVKLHIGAEVFFLPNLLELRKNMLCTFGNGRYMLIEFQTHQLPPGYDDELYSLVMSGTTPIIAHPERYRPIQNNINIVEKLINSGCLMQIDAGSLLGQFGENCKKTAEIMLGRNMVHFMGSDAHNDGKRNFCLELAVDVCKGIIGDYTTSLVYDNPQKLLNGEKVIPLEIIDEKEGFVKSILKKIKLN